MGTERYSDLLRQIDYTRLPAHIAIIMDGNGRWASRRHLPRSAGHKAGAEALRRVSEVCRELGLSILSVYAFSTENWRRGEDEVGFLMRLLVEYLQNEVELLNRQDIRLGFLGRREELPPPVLAALEQALTATAGNSSMRLNLAINYGSRDEILRAAREIARLAVAGRLNPGDIDGARFSSLLDTAGQADPDLLIRPSGEQRISNFLLWQAAYSELYFCDKLWPDFGKRDLLAAVIAYQTRERRFGGVK